MIEVVIESGRLAVGHETPLRVRFSNKGPGACTDIVFKLGLPPGLLLVGGRNSVEMPRILPGEEHVHVIQVEPTRAGEFEMRGRNFSYRDESGVPIRPPQPPRARLVVLPARPAEPVPQRAPLHIAHGGAELELGEWDVFPLSVRSTTGVPLSDVTLSIQGPIKTDTTHATVSAIASGASVDVPFAVFAVEGGRHVPLRVHATFVYADEAGRRRRGEHDERLDVAVGQVTPKQNRPTTGQTVLYLAASPKDQKPLRSDEEMRNVRERLQLGRYRDSFRLEPCVAARLADISQALIDHEPRIVHFSGHGQPDGRLLVEDESGYTDLVTPDGLAALFGLQAVTIRCVIVNACHSIMLAQAIAKKIDYVVGMRCEIGDEAAILFSVGFYQGLFAGRPVPDAFDRGCALVQAKQALTAESKTPVLFRREA
jgi:CHAT domain